MTRRRKMAIELLSDIGSAAQDLGTYSDPEIAKALEFMRQVNGPLFDWLLKALTPTAPGGRRGGRARGRLGGAVDG